jgi:hypothetical protein
MWTEILVTNDVERKDKLKQLLNAHSILCRIKTIKNENSTSYGILVPYAEANISVELMLDNNLN